MKSNTLCTLATIIAMCAGSAAVAEPAKDSVKSSKDLLKKWSLTRSIGGPKIAKRKGSLSQSELNRLRSAAASARTRGLATSATRGIEVIPVDPSATATGGVPVSITVDAGSMESFSNIRFKLDSTEFADEVSRSQVDEIAATLLQMKNEQFLIEGHTCDLGTDEHNHSLSEQRARAVFTALVQKGVSPANLAVMGMGESLPEAPNDTETSRQQNRRVVVARRLDTAAARN